MSRNHMSYNESDWISSVNRNLRETKLNISGINMRNSAQDRHNSLSNSRSFTTDTGYIPTSSDVDYKMTAIRDARKSDLNREVSNNEVLGRLLSRMESLENSININQVSSPRSIYLNHSSIDNIPTQQWGSPHPKTPQLEMKLQQMELSFNIQLDRMASELAETKRSCDSLRQSNIRQAEEIDNMRRELESRRSLSAKSDSVIRHYDQQHSSLESEVAALRQQVRASERMNRDHEEFIRGAVTRADLDAGVYLDRLVGLVYKSVLSNLPSSLLSEGGSSVSSDTKQVAVNTDDARIIETVNRAVHQMASDVEERVFNRSLFHLRGELREAKEAIMQRVDEIRAAVGLDAIGDARNAFRSGALQEIERDVGELVLRVDAAETALASSRAQSDVYEKRMIAEMGSFQDRIDGCYKASETLLASSRERASGLENLVRQSEGALKEEISRASNEMVNTVNSITDAWNDEQALIKKRMLLVERLVESVVDKVGQTKRDVQGTIASVPEYKKMVQMTSVLDRVQTDINELKSNGRKVSSLIQNNEGDASVIKRDLALLQEQLLAMSDLNRQVSDLDVTVQRTFTSLLDLKKDIKSNSQSLVSRTDLDAFRQELSAALEKSNGSTFTSFKSLKTEFSELRSAIDVLSDDVVTKTVSTAEKRVIEDKIRLLQMSSANETVDINCKLENLEAHNLKLDHSILTLASKAEGVVSLQREAKGLSQKYADLSSEIKVLESFSKSLRREFEDLQLSLTVERSSDAISPEEASVDYDISARKRSFTVEADGSPSSKMSSKIARDSKSKFSLESRVTEKDGNGSAEGIAIRNIRADSRKFGLQSLRKEVDDLEDHSDVPIVSTNSDRKTMYPDKLFSMNALSRPLTAINSVTDSIIIKDDNNDDKSSSNSSYYGDLSRGKPLHQFKEFGEESFEHESQESSLDNDAIENLLFTAVPLKNRGIRDSGFSVRNSDNEPLNHVDAAKGDGLGVTTRSVDDSENSLRAPVDKGQIKSKLNSPCSKVGEALDLEGNDDIPELLVHDTEGVSADVVAAADKGYSNKENQNEIDDESIREQANVRELDLDSMRDHKLNADQYEDSLDSTVRAKSFINLVVNEDEVTNRSCANSFDSEEEDNSSSVKIFNDNDHEIDGEDKSNYSEESDYKESHAYQSVSDLGSSPQPKELSKFLVSGVSNNANDEILPELIPDMSFSSEADALSCSSDKGLGIESDAQVNKLPVASHIFDEADNVVDFADYGESDSHDSAIFVTSGLIGYQEIKEASSVRSYDYSNVHTSHSNDLVEDIGSSDAPSADKSHLKESRSIDDKTFILQKPISNTEKTTLDSNFGKLNEDDKNAECRIHNTAKLNTLDSKRSKQDDIDDDDDDVDYDYDDADADDGDDDYANHHRYHHQSKEANDVKNRSEDIYTKTDNSETSGAKDQIPITYSTVQGKLSSERDYKNDDDDDIVSKRASSIPSSNTHPYMKRDYNHLAAVNENKEAGNLRFNDDVLDVSSHSGGLEEKSSSDESSRGELIPGDNDMDEAGDSISASNMYKKKSDFSRSDSDGDILLLRPSSSRDKSMVEETFSREASNNSTLDPNGSHDEHVPETSSVSRVFDFTKSRSTSNPLRSSTDLGVDVDNLSDGSTDVIDAEDIEAPIVNSKYSKESDAGCCDMITGDFVESSSNDPVYHEASAITSASKRRQVEESKYYDRDDGDAMDRLSASSISALNTHPEIKNYLKHQAAVSDNNDDTEEFSFDNDVLDVSSHSGGLEAKSNSDESSRGELIPGDNDMDEVDDPISSNNTFQKKSDFSRSDSDGDILLLRPSSSRDKSMVEETFSREASNNSTLDPNGSHDEHVPETSSVSRVFDFTKSRSTSNPLRSSTDLGVDVDNLSDGSTDVIDAEDLEAPIVNSKYSKESDAGCCDMITGDFVESSSNDPVYHEASAITSASKRRQVEESKYYDRDDGDAMDRLSASSISALNTHPEIKNYLKHQAAMSDNNDDTEEFSFDNDVLDVSSHSGGLEAKSNSDESSRGELIPGDNDIDEVDDPISSNNTFQKKSDFSRSDSDGDILLLRPSSSRDKSMVEGTFSREASSNSTLDPNGSHTEPVHETSSVSRVFDSTKSISASNPLRLGVDVDNLSDDSADVIDAEDLEAPIVNNTDSKESYAGSYDIKTGDFVESSSNDQLYHDVSTINLALKNKKVEESENNDKDDGGVIDSLSASSISALNTHPEIKNYLKQRAAISDYNDDTVEFSFDDDVLDVSSHSGGLEEKSNSDESSRGELIAGDNDMDEADDSISASNMYKKKSDFSRSDSDGDILLLRPSTSRDKSMVEETFSREASNNSTLDPNGSHIEPVHESSSVSRVFDFTKSRSAINPLRSSTDLGVDVDNLSDGSADVIDAEDLKAPKVNNTYSKESDTGNYDIKTGHFVESSSNDPVYHEASAINSASKRRQVEESKYNDRDDGDALDSLRGSSIPILNTHQEIKSYLNHKAALSDNNDDTVEFSFDDDVLDVSRQSGGLEEKSNSDESSRGELIPGDNDMDEVDDPIPASEMYLKKSDFLRSDSDGDILLLRPSTSRDKSMVNDMYPREPSHDSAFDLNGSHSEPVHETSSVNRVFGFTKSISASNHLRKSTDLRVNVDNLSDDSADVIDVEDFEASIVKNTYSKESGAGSYDVKTGDFVESSSNDQEHTEFSRINSGLKYRQIEEGKHNDRDYGETLDSLSGSSIPVLNTHPEIKSNLKHHAAMSDYIGETVEFSFDDVLDVESHSCGLESKSNSDESSRGELIPGEDDMDEAGDSISASHLYQKKSDFSQSDSRISLLERISLSDRSKIEEPFSREASNDSTLDPNGSHAEHVHESRDSDFARSITASNHLRSSTDLGVDVDNLPDDSADIIGVEDLEAPKVNSTYFEESDAGSYDMKTGDFVEFSSNDKVHQDVSAITSALKHGKVEEDEYNDIYYGYALDSLSASSIPALNTHPEIKNYLKHHAALSDNVDDTGEFSFEDDVLDVSSHSGGLEEKSNSDESSRGELIPGDNDMDEADDPISSSNMYKKKSDFSRSDSDGDILLLGPSASRDKSLIEETFSREPSNDSTFDPSKSLTEPVHESSSVSSDFDFVRSKSSGRHSSPLRSSRHLALPASPSGRIPTPPPDSLFSDATPSSFRGLLPISSPRNGLVETHSQSSSLMRMENRSHSPKSSSDTLSLLPPVISPPLSIKERLKIRAEQNKADKLK